MILWYNSVALSYIATNFVSFEPVNDPVAGVDLMYVRVVIDVNAVIAEAALPALPGESPAAAVARIEHLLNSPRRGLRMMNSAGVTVTTVGTTNTLDNTALPALDANNGPVPQRVLVTKLYDGSVAINFRVSACIVDCPGQPALPWVSYRYTETHDIDDLAMSKRTRSGTVVTRTDMLVNPDALRGLVSPPLEPEFRRISSRYAIDPAGNKLHFEFVDQEVYITPPLPAARASGFYQVSTNNGAAHFGEVGLNIQGGKPTDKGVLMSRAIAVAYAKLIGDPNDPLVATDRQGRFMLLATFREELYENGVSVQMRAMLKPPRSRKNGINADLRGFGTRPIGSDPGSPPFDPGLRGTAQLGMIAQALRDPCLYQTALTASPQSPNLPNTRSTNVPAQVSITAIGSDDEQTLRTKPENEKGLYESYNLRSITNKKENKFAMPSGKKGGQVSVIQTAEPSYTRTVEFTATKVGGQPRIPNPYPSDANVELLEADIDTGQVEPTPDGVSLRYTVSGRMTWVYKDGSKVTLASTLPPWVDLQSSGEAVLKPYDLSNDIVQWGQLGTSPTFSTPLVGGSGGGSFADGGPIVPGVNG